MTNYFHTSVNPSVVVNEVKSSIRDIRIKMLLNDKSESLFKPSLSKLKWGDKRLKLFTEKWYPIVKSWKGKSVITGSLCLYVCGLLDRKPTDIDLIADELVFKENSNKLGEKIYQNRYPGMENKIKILGYYEHKGIYNVDFFKLENQKFIEVDGFLFHDPFEILLTKALLYEINKKSKDRQDLISCLDNIWELI